MSSERSFLTRTLANLARTIFWVGLLVIMVQQVRGPARLETSAPPSSTVSSSNDIRGSLP